MEGTDIKQTIKAAEKTKKNAKILLVIGVVLLIIMGVFALFDVAPDEGPMVLGWIGIVLLGVGVWKLLNAPSTEELKKKQADLTRILEEEKKNEELKPLVEAFWPENDILAIKIVGEDHDWMELFRVSMIVEKGEIKMKCTSPSDYTLFPVKHNEGKFYVLSKTGDIYPIEKDRINMGKEIFVLLKNDSDLSIIEKAYEMLFSKQEQVAIKSGEKPLNELTEDIRTMMPHYHFKLGPSTFETDLKRLGASIVDNYFHAVANMSGEVLQANRTVYEYFKVKGLPEYGTHDIVYRSDALSLDLSRLDLAMTQFANRTETGDIPELGSDPSTWITQINACVPIFNKLVHLEKTTHYIFHVSRCKLSKGIILFELVNILSITDKLSVKYKVNVGYTEGGNVILGIDDGLYIVENQSIDSEDLGLFDRNSLLPINHNSSLMKEFRTEQTGM